MRKAKLVVLKFIVYGLLIYGGLIFLMLVMQTRMIFPATRNIYRTPAQLGMAFDELHLPVGAHTTHAWFLPIDNARGVALFSHGNAGNIADRLESIALLQQLGFSVLAYDYGGYGKSTGRISEERCYQDIRAMWRWLTEFKEYEPEEILLFGRSLGAAVTAQLATEVTPGAIILESTFLSMPEIAKDHFFWLPVGLFLRYKFETQEKVGQFTAPLMYIHSRDDTIIPYRHGEQLYELAADPKQFLEIQGDHNEGFVMSMKLYKAGWEGFLAPLMPRPQKELLPD